jgi:GH15 family glucan-1,4-alpha-glucosidase
MYKKISDYGVIGNLYTVALVGLDGSVDWLCLPHIDSPSVFGAILDDRKGGRFSAAPIGDWKSSAEYHSGTNILVTTFSTENGVLRLTDFMPVAGEVNEEKSKRHELYRLLEIAEGKVDVVVVFEPRFDYARAETGLERVNGGVLASGGGEMIGLSSSHDIQISAGKSVTRLSLSGGDRVWLHLTYGTGELCRCDPDEAERSLNDTRRFWEEWLKKSETGRTIELGPYREMVERSELVLKLLYFEPTGAIAAAATTSLPEEIGGERNWDYRYTWVRDSSLTLQALFNLGHLSETEGYVRWINRILKEGDVSRLKIMYGIRGEERLEEIELEHLEGYRGSRPVRIGNSAAEQRQLDIYGEFMDASLKLSDYVGKIDIETWPLLRSICDYVVQHWKEMDAGIWEVRGGPYHFVYSKVMCWVALDRGLTIARRYGFHADLDMWEKARLEIIEEVLEKGWDEKKQAFRQHYGTDGLDASNLLIPALGFLPHDDPRVISNLEATVRELGHDGFIYRYRAADGLRGGEGTFLICAFWLVDNLIALGRLEDAEDIIRRLGRASNHLGLFSEEYDHVRGEALGNFPQAFTHIGCINSITALMRAKSAAVEERATVSLRGTLVLNKGESSLLLPPSELAMRLKNSMNILRGAYFDTSMGRVAYERMKKSGAYREYVNLSHALVRMDPEELKGREENLAFWINLYNVIVIHGVVEMGIKDSVKEVKDFFKRVMYRVGDFYFSPEDIEHGILRGNRKPPHSLRKRFGDGDLRLRHSVVPVDPRVHFSLVCASSSCPPIGVYTADGIDRELDVAGATFVNGGGLLIDRKEGRASLSRVFKWYARDFGRDRAEVLRSLASYLYKEGDRDYILSNAERLRVSYQDYDWRLNRY